MRYSFLLGVVLVLVWQPGAFGSSSRTDKIFTSSPSRPGSVWPQPQAIKETGKILTLDPSSFTFQYIKPNSKCLIIEEAISRYQDLIFLKKCQPFDVPSGFVKLPFSESKASFNSSQEEAASLKKLIINIEQPCESLPPAHMNELYELAIGVTSTHPPDTAVMFAHNVWGALRGLETFSQLVFLQDQKFYIREQYVLDFPRFPYRGLLVDTSRHFIPVNVLLQNLDAMAYNKLNVFHWHIVDDQSFPYVSSLFPNLSKMGSFQPDTHIYTPKDIRRVIKYAAKRGIRVIPEFDTPGHTQSWGLGQPDLLTPCPGGGYGPVNPILDSTYKFLSQLFLEVAQVFPDSHFFAGGDEVDFSCWESNPDIQAFMKQKNWTDLNQLFNYYFNHVVDIQHTLKKTTIAWQEVFDSGVKTSNDTIFNVWKGPMDEMKNITDAGYPAILSSCWYFNEIHYGPDWEVPYLCDPQNFTGKNKNLVLGGEACMWGEYVDGSNLISRTWPRASSAAERLWSAASVNDLTTALPRFEEHRCRMQRRGLRAEPINGPGFCPCDFMY